jgi:hypothetical protein
MGRGRILAALDDAPGQWPAESAWAGKEPAVHSGTVERKTCQGPRNGWAASRPGGPATGWVRRGSSSSHGKWEKRKGATAYFPRNVAPFPSTAVLAALSQSFARTQIYRVLFILFGIT